jgi:hypothetical protein
MDIHPDAVMPQSPCVAPTTPVRVDSSAPLRVDAAKNRDATAAHLRARLLKMIVENEKSRQRPSIESRPR